VATGRRVINSCTVISAYGIVLRFHLGTAACGGLILSVVQFFRWVALYIEKHCKGVQNNLIGEVTYRMNESEIHHFPPLGCDHAIFHMINLDNPFGSTCDILLR
jgi:Plasma-membrane choline transporter